MPLTILSPHSGQPVKVRDQDIERAIRDEKGRIFYVVQRPDGGGCYASLTRKGSQRDLERYDKLNTRSDQQQDIAAQAIVHDATGRARRSLVGSIMRILVLAILLTLLGLMAMMYLQANERDESPSPSPFVPESSLVPETLLLPSEGAP